MLRKKRAMYLCYDGLLICCQNCKNLDSDKNYTALIGQKGKKMIREDEILDTLESLRITTICASGRPPGFDPDPCNKARELIARLKSGEKVISKRDAAGAERKRVFICGAYNDVGILPCLSNIREGIKAAITVLRLGYSPFCPMLDFQFALVEGGDSLTLEDYRGYCHSWLLVSDIMVVLSGWREAFHKGVVDEIRLAEIWGIPIYFSIEKFVSCHNTKKSSGESCPAHES